MAGSHTSWHGVFTETAAGAGLGYDLHGSAKMTIGADGTNVKITVARHIDREPVQYVSNIYKYYVAYRLMAARRSGSSVPNEKP